MSLPAGERERQADADEATLMGLVLHPDLAPVLDDVLRLVKPEDFYSPPRAAIWRVAERYRMGGSVIEIGGVHEALGAMLGGVQLNRCFEIISRECVHAPVAEWAVTTAERVRDRARMRKVGQLGQRLQQLADLGQLDAFDDVMSQVTATWRQIEDVASASASDDVVRIVDYVDEYLGELAGGPMLDLIPTPWTDVNALFSGGGLRPGGMYIFAARPGDGKTLAGGGIAQYAAESGYQTIMFSAEMTKREITDRWMARALRAELGDFTSFAPSEQSLLDAKAHGEWMRSVDLPLAISDTAGMSVPFIAAQARRWKRQHDLRLIVVDYVQLLKAGPGANRQEQVGDMSTALKQLAKELDIVVVVLAQLNRAGGDVPQLHHLRESGRLEQDADGVVLISRPTETIEEPDGRSFTSDLGVVKFDLAKNRHGRTGEVELSWRAHYGDITDR